MTRPKKSIAVILTLAAAVGMTGCSTSVAPDEVGLYYMKGPSDGNKFGHCMDPGNADDGEYNNQIVFLPASLRTWNISTDEAADSKAPITVSAKPEAGQPSGVQVNVWSQTNLVLNTNCDDIGGFPGGTLRKFWETLGRRYNAGAADKDPGWTKVMLVTVVPALEKSTRSVIRGYGADELVANKDGILTDVQAKISAEFAAELTRLSGGQFFCGPTFVRGKTECPPVELIIKDVDFADPGIQEARNQKQKAVEQAAAAVATAQGQVDAANKMNELYKNTAWVELQKAQKQLEIAQACRDSAKCTMVMTSDGIQVHTGN